MHARGRDLHARASDLSARVSDLHALAAIFHPLVAIVQPLVADLYVRVSDLHARVGGLHGGVRGFYARGSDVHQRDGLAERFKVGEPRVGAVERRRVTALSIPCSPAASRGRNLFYFASRYYFSAASATNTLGSIGWSRPTRVRSNSRVARRARRARHVVCGRASCPPCVVV